MSVHQGESAALETLSETLARRVEGLIQSHRGGEFHSTTGTRAAVEELIARNDGLEKVVMELATELERLAARVERTFEQFNERDGHSYSVTLPGD